MLHFAAGCESCSFVFAGDRGLDRNEGIGTTGSRRRGWHDRLCKALSYAERALFETSVYGVESTTTVRLLWLGFGPAVKVECMYFPCWEDVSVLSGEISRNLEGLQMLY